MKNRLLHSVIAVVIATLELSLGITKAKAADDFVPSPTLIDPADDLDFLSVSGSESDNSEEVDLHYRELDSRDINPTRMTAVVPNAPVTTSSANADFSFSAVDTPKSLLKLVQETAVPKPSEPVFLPFSVEENASDLQPFETLIALDFEEKEETAAEPIQKSNLETSANSVALVSEEAPNNDSAGTTATLLALISALDTAEDNAEATADVTQTLLALISEEIEAQSNAETVETLLALVAALEEDEAATVANAETTSMLLALITDLESGDTEAVKRAVTLLSLRLDLDEEDTSQKAPWLASSLSGEMDSAEATEVGDALQIALRSPDTPSAQIEKRTEPWLALADPDDNGEDESARPGEPWIAFPEENDGDDNQKAPWLARANPSAADRQNPEADDNLLSINLQQSEPGKRSGAWISLTPIELTAPNDNDVAVNIEATRQETEAYDVRNLSRVAITPADLASDNEIAISVDANDIEFLSPEAGAFLDVPATAVVLRFPIGANIALLVNGQVVDSALVGRTETDADTQLRTQSWYGIPLVSGGNVLEVISTETGEVLQRMPLTVRGQPEQLVLLSSRSIPADGRSTASIRGQLVDAFGNISRWDSVATIQSSDGRFIGADYDPDMPGYQVEVLRGEFVAELQSSLESHLVQLQAMANGFEAFGQVQFDTPQRTDLISGVIDFRLGARGTDFYDSYREFLPIDGDNSYEFDVDAAVFATGNLGEWLYTGAYNSDRTLNENCHGESTLFRTANANCNNVYATYGDDSYTDVVTPSIDSVYLRLERNSPTTDSGIDYVMWGDFNTEELAAASQLFTATNRQLHGFKANYNFGDLAFTGLYADNVEGFQRDTIAPDGTSGFYFTSQRDLVPGSENIFLELEELERPGTVLDRVPLVRGLDYEIDYDRGTILFKDPITRTAVDDFGQVLVRRIVTTYQHEDGGDTNILAGRARYSLDDRQGQESWVGATYLNQDQGSRDFTLYGADARISLGQQAQITAEIAESTTDFDATGEVSGSAYRLELEGDLGDALNGRAYVRSTDAGFTNSATTSFVPGQTRYGAQLSGRISEDTSVRARFDHEDNFGTAPRVVTDLAQLLSGEDSLTGRALDNSLTTYSLGVSQRLGRATAEIDWIHRDRTDALNNDTNVTSDQLRTRLTAPISDRLSLVAQNELNLSSGIDPIYPSRTLLGINWEAMRGVNVGVNQVFFGGGGNNRGSATSIDVTGEHTFASDTTVRGRFSTIDGRQIGGTIGLEQGINLAPGLDLDLGYEKVFSTLGNDTAAGTQFSQAFATGRGASSIGLSGGESYNVGLSYTDNPDFQASTRFEHRSGFQRSNTVFNVSALGRVTPELTLLGDYRMANAANQNITGLGRTSLLKLGMAYRNPDDDRFNALLRYEHRMNPNSIPRASLGASTETQEHLFSAEAIYAPDWRWELFGKYALRNSRTEINGANGNFSGSNTVQLAQARATYRLGYRWDIVGELRWLGGSGYSETGYSIEGGYYPLPDLRLSAGYSGGTTDYDFGENRDAGGFYLGATAKLSGLLNDFSTQPNNPAQQQESALEVSSDRTQSTPLQPTVDSVSSPQFTNRAPRASDVEDAFNTEPDLDIEPALDIDVLTDVETF